MPPRLRPQSRVAHIYIAPQFRALQRCSYAAIATATTPAVPIDQTLHAVPSIQRYPSTQPPSHKPPEFRKSQLHRQYTSLLRSSPLILLFQHNNLKANEWVAIRRELAHALRQVDADIQKNASEGQTIQPYADSIKIQIMQTGIFGAALRVVEFYRPEASSPEVPGAATPMRTEPELTHGLSRAAHTAANRSKKLRHGLEPLLSGPLAVVKFPAVTPQHLKAVLSILAPSPEFPAPKRKTRPAFHEPAVQLGLQKLMMLAARVEGKIFDQAGIRWVGGIDGGIDGLRAQLVRLLSSLGASLTTALEGASKSLYFTMEGRKGQLEGEENGETKGPEDSS